MKVSINERRFLIIWFVIHVFALVANVVPIEGKMVDVHEPNAVSVHREYLFTNKGSSNGFWPFVTFYFYSNDRYFQGYGPNGTGLLQEWKEFNGIFYQYDAAEFAVYSLLGLCIIFLPKLWGSQ